MAENTNLLNPASNNFFSDNNFLYKAIFVSILVLVIPLFIPASTQEAPPDFINKTTSWEVVQLVLVGIAVSYGLFSSKRNDQPKTQDKEDEHDQHAPLSYVSRLLQVPSSVFDDDDDEKQMVENNSKVVERTWNSQYHRGEPPIVVVAKESSSVDDANTTIEKLCLSPSVVRGRSLKQSPNNNNNNNTKEGDNYYYYRKSLSSISGSSSSFSTGTGKRRFSRNLSCPEEESKEEDNIVLRSPVPWRSRSGRMQLKEEEKEEIQSKSLHEDVVRKKMYPQSSTIPTPPPPPPPPPPPQRLVLLNNNKSRINTSTRYALHNQDSQNRARQGGRLVEAVTPTHKYHHSLSHDKEIESFIQTRGGSQKKKKNMDDGAAAAADDDDDDDTQTQSFMEHPKKQQRQASGSTRIKDSDQSSSSGSEDSEDEEDNDDELQELASTKNNNVMNEEEMMSGSDHNVDKKADEFIAKFREQIRLQRIASIRTTTTQAKTKTGPTTR